MLSFLSDNEYHTIPYVMYKMNDIESQKFSLSDRYLIIVKEVELIYPDQVEVYMQNMVGLGLFELIEDKRVVGDLDRLNSETEYLDETEKEFLDSLEISKETTDKRPEIIVGCYLITKLGEMFMEVCTTGNKDFNPSENVSSASID